MTAHDPANEIDVSKEAVERLVLLIERDQRRPMKEIIIMLRALASKVERLEGERDEALHEAGCFAECAMDEADGAKYRLKRMEKAEARAELAEQRLAEARHLLGNACSSVENQANWDKSPYCEWYYRAKASLQSQEPSHD